MRAANIKKINFAYKENIMPTLIADVSVEDFWFPIAIKDDKITGCKRVLVAIGELADRYLSMSFGSIEMFQRKSTIRDVYIWDGEKQLPKIGLCPTILRIINFVTFLLLPLTLIAFGAKYLYKKYHVNSYVTAYCTHTPKEIYAEGQHQGRKAILSDSLSVAPALTVDAKRHIIKTLPNWLKSHFNDAHPEQADQQQINDHYFDFMGADLIKKYSNQKTSDINDVSDISPEDIEKLYAEQQEVLIKRLVDEQTLYYTPYILRALTIPNDKDPILAKVAAHIMYKAWTAAIKHCQKENRWNHGAFVHLNAITSDSYHIFIRAVEDNTKGGSQSLSTFTHGYWKDSPAIYPRVDVYLAGNKIGVFAPEKTAV